jgi:hypothetical protein
MKGEGREREVEMKKGRRRVMMGGEEGERSECLRGDGQGIGLLGEGSAGGMMCHSEEIIEWS